MILRTRQFLEYAALRAVAWLIGILPYRAALFTGWLLALLIFYVARFRVSSAKARIRQVFGTKFTEKEISEIAWLSYRNIVFSGIEMIRISKMTLEWFGSVTDWLPVIAEIRKHTDTGRGSIIAVGHTGSWEMAAIACQFAGVPIFSLTGRQKNPYTDAYMNSLRKSTGVEGIPRGSGAMMRAILRNLAAGKSLAIMPDVRMRTGAISVPFLGGIANIGNGMASFARQADVPIFPCLVTRHGWATHRGVMCKPIWPDKTLSKEEDIRRMTLAVMKHVEDLILQDPAQWFWFNKRWILDPIDKTDH